MDEVGMTEHVNESFNRTFMELKYEYYRCCHGCCNSFNRTFMELKFRDFMIAMMVLCSNRTFMELKFRSTTILPAPTLVLIAPLWI